MSEAIWQEVECGGYVADLELWRKLADDCAGADGTAKVLDLGAGVGRVSLDLAAHGHDLTALDGEQELLDELARRADKGGLSVRRICADAREFALRSRFDLVIAPMQLVQLLGGAGRRAGLYESAAACLRADGLLAIALMDMSGEPTDASYHPPLPDLREIEGWVYSSQPLAVRTLDRGREIALERLRSAVSPKGEISEQHNTIKLRLVGPETCEAEARAADLEPAGRIAIAVTADHVGSVVVLLRRR